MQSAESAVRKAIAFLGSGMGKATSALFYTDQLDDAAPLGGNEPDHSPAR